MAFQRATKTQVKLRLALFGPSGSGKTYTSLRIASGIGGRIAVIDSERNSASRYADRFVFDADTPGDKTIKSYIQAINESAKAGYDVLIIDSLSHAWKELLQEVERLARSKFKGNSWSAWSEGTPMQQTLVDAILSYPGHIIVTMRSKTEWIQEESNGKSKPVRVGLAPEQGKGIEYEFDILLELTTDHLGTVIKDRTGKFQDKTIDKPGEDFGAALRDWLSDGAEPAPEKTPEPPPPPAPKAPAPPPVPKRAAPAPPPAPKKAEPEKPTLATDPAYKQARKEIIADLRGVFLSQGKTEADWDTYVLKLRGKSADDLEVLLADFKKKAAANAKAAAAQPEPAKEVETVAV